MDDSARGAQYVPVPDVVAIDGWLENYFFSSTETGGKQVLAAGVGYLLGIVGTLVAYPLGYSFGDEWAGGHVGGVAVGASAYVSLASLGAVNVADLLHYYASKQVTRPNTFPRAAGLGYACSGMFGAIAAIQFAYVTGLHMGGGNVGSVLLATVGFFVYMVINSFAVQAMNDAACKWYLFRKNVDAKKKHKRLELLMSRGVQWVLSDECSLDHTKQLMACFKENGRSSSASVDSVDKGGPRTPPRDVSGEAGDFRPPHTMGTPPRLFGDDSSQAGEPNVSVRVRSHPPTMAGGGTVAEAERASDGPCRLPPDVRAGSGQQATSASKSGEAFALPPVRLGAEEASGSGVAMVAMGAAYPQSTQGRAALRPSAQNENENKHIDKMKRFLQLLETFSSNHPFAEDFGCAAGLFFKVAYGLGILSGFVHYFITVEAGHSFLAWVGQSAANAPWYVVLIAGMAFFGSAALGATKNHARAKQLAALCSGNGYRYIQYASMYRGRIVISVLGWICGAAAAIPLTELHYSYVKDNHLNNLLFLLMIPTFVAPMCIRSDAFEQLFNRLLDFIRRGSNMVKPGLEDHKDIIVAKSNRLWRKVDELPWRAMVETIDELTPAPTRSVPAA